MEDVALKKLNITAHDLRAQQDLRTFGGAILHRDGRATLINSDRELPPERLDRLLRRGLCKLARDGLLEGFPQTVVPAGE